MKKIFLTMGAMASVITPVVAVVSCGDDNKTNNAGGSTVIPVEASKASAAITAFVGADGATTTGAGNDITDLVVADFETQVSVNHSYTFSVAGHDMTAFGVILTLKADKSSGIKWLGGTVTNPEYVAGSTITLIATPDEDDATEVDKVYVEFKHGSTSSTTEISNDIANNRQFKNTVEAAIKAAGFGA